MCGLYIKHKTLGTVSYFSKLSFDQEFTPELHLCLMERGLELLLEKHEFESHFHPLLSGGFSKLQFSHQFGEKTIKTFQDYC